MSLLGPLLEAFVAVSDRKSVHAASRLIGISQTGVTQRIRTLERSLDTTLFTRSRRGMLLTSEGSALLRYCQAARDLEGQALAAIGGAGSRTAVRVTVTGTTSIMRSRVVPACATIAKKYPNLLLSFRVTDTETWLDDLRTGEAQLAVVPRETVVRELESKLLKSERYVLLGPRPWKGRPIGEIVREERLIDFGPTDRMSHLYLRHYKLLEDARPERHFVNNNEALADLIQKGLGYGVFESAFASQFLQRCDLVELNGGKSYEHRLALTWYSRPTSPPYWKALISGIG